MSELAFDNLSENLQEKLQTFYHDCSVEDQPSLLLAELASLDKRFDNKTDHAKGGMKQVFKVNDLRTKRPVALAALREDSEQSNENVGRFLREARITAALEHPNIVPIYDIGLDEAGKPFFTMKFLKDQSLRKILKELAKQNPVYTKEYTFTVLLDIFMKICDAVAFAHSCKIIHLDLKPENIMIGDYGEVYVCDWGLAKLLGAVDMGEPAGGIHLDAVELNSYTLSGIVKGTPGFMAPEQIDSKLGEKDYRTDVYALGALLYSLLTFRQPFYGLSNEKTIDQTLHGSPKKIEELSYRPVPEGIAAICRKAMAKIPDVRYQNVNQIIKDVRFFQEGFATQAENLTIKKSLILSYKRNRFKYIAFSVMALIAVLASVVVSGKLSQMQKDHDSQIQSITDKKNKEYEELRIQAQKDSSEIKNALFQAGKSVDLIKSKYDNIVLSPPLIIGRGVTFEGNGSGLIDENFIFRSGTVSFWFKPEKYGTKYVEFFQLGNMKWYLDYSGKNERKPTVAGSHISFSPDTLGNPLWGGWHHFSCTSLKSGVVMFYIDGQSHYIGSVYDGKQLGFALGRLVSTKSTHSFRGSFDELTFWQKVLSPNEMKELKHKGIRGEEGGLKAYYRLDKDFKDSVGNEPELKASGKYSFTK